jgi:hypothetical protein
VDEATEVAAVAKQLVDKQSRSVLSNTGEE